MIKALFHQFFIFQCLSLNLWADGNSEEVSASVNWLQEVVNGGVTSIALGILCLGSIGVLIERAMQLKIHRFAPETLTQEAMKLWKPGGIPSLLKLTQQNESILAKVIHFAAKHHKANPDMIFSGASDIIHRSMRKENQTNTLLAVSAALAPLLGLLGTMIGMIESFKLVELYGDEGGASMLAGSISKALITTAVGLIIAIMSLVAYHYYKLRISSLTMECEEKVEELLSLWFLPSVTLPPKEKAGNNREEKPNPNSSKAMPDKPASPQKLKKATKAPIAATPAS
jgi:biopolymer transport protein ExbB